MKQSKKNAFTLIELIAVLVIMAIIALIVTPLVMTIIRKARISADKRSIDAYGRSIELAIAGYLMDTGDFPADINQLTIEYSGDAVTCETTQLNSDSTVYLAGCTVGGRSVEGYAYGSDKSPSYESYNIGDEVTYNGVNFYVIENSDSKNDKVTMLKAEPLTVTEVSTYGGVNTELNHVNMYVTTDETSEWYQKVVDQGNTGYGGMIFYSSSSCGHVNTGNISSGCTSDYAQSEVKYVVDAWAQDKFGTDNNYIARLITYDELMNNLGYEYYEQGTENGYRATNSTPEWVMGENYAYWTMTPYNDSTGYMWAPGCFGRLGSGAIYSDSYENYSGDVDFKVRPVLELNKSADITKID